MAVRDRVRRLASLAPPRLFSSPGDARILVYHSVSDDPLNPFAVSPASFHAQMAHLRAHRNVVPLVDLATALAGGRSLPAGSVAVTFDDGYLDNYEAAFPVLAKFSIPASVFLVAGSIGGEDGPSGGGGGTTGSGPGPGEPGTSDGDIVFMTWAQAREMARGGVTFGSHTMTHPSLSGLGDGALAAELRDSKSLIERMLGTGIDSVAYPYGTHRDVDAAVIAAARAAGYTHGCMAVNGTVKAGTDSMSMPRTKIEFGDDIGMFGRALDGALDVFTLLDGARRLRGKRTPGV